MDVQIDEVADENAAAYAPHSTWRPSTARRRRASSIALRRLDADKTLLFTLSRRRRHSQPRGRAPGDRARCPTSRRKSNVTLQGHRHGDHADGPTAGGRRGFRRLWRRPSLVRLPRRRRARRSSGRSSAAAGARKSLPSTASWKSRELELQAQAEVALGGAGRRRRSRLAGGPNIGTSQQYVLDVVTPEQLRSMLEARELMLRRRFETIIEELTDTRDLLATCRAGNQRRNRAGRQGADEPGRADGPEVPGRRRHGTALPRRCRSSACCKTASAAATRRCRWPGVRRNPRGDDQQPHRHRRDLKTRLKEGVADPLKRIVERPVLEAPRANSSNCRRNCPTRQAAVPTQTAGRGPNRRDPRRDEASP